jgi:hypothetical protein
MNGKNVSLSFQTEPSISFTVTAGRSTATFSDASWVSLRRTLMAMLSKEDVLRFIGKVDKFFEERLTVQRRQEEDTENEDDDDSTYVPSEEEEEDDDDFTESEGEDEEAEEAEEADGDENVEEEEEDDGDDDYVPSHSTRDSLRTVQQRGPTLVVTLRTPTAAAPRRSPRLAKH